MIEHATVAMVKTLRNILDRIDSVTEMDALLVKDIRGSCTRIYTIFVL
jgi:hypothetical protein